MDSGAMTTAKAALVSVVGAAEEAVVAEAEAVNGVALIMTGLVVDSVVALVAGETLIATATPTGRE